MSDQDAYTWDLIGNSKGTEIEQDWIRLPTVVTLMQLPEVDWGCVQR